MQHQVERSLRNSTDPSLSPAPKRSLCHQPTLSISKNRGRGRLFRLSRNPVRMLASCFLPALLRTHLDVSYIWRVKTLRMSMAWTRISHGAACNWHMKAAEGNSYSAGALRKPAYINVKKTHTHIHTQRDKNRTRKHLVMVSMSISLDPNRPALFKGIMHFISFLWAHLWINQVYWKMFLKCINFCRW